MNFKFLNATCSIAINDVIFGKPQQRAKKSTNSQNKRTHNLKLVEVFIRKILRCYRLHY